MASVAVALRVTVAPAIIVVPCTVMVEGLGVLAEVVSVRIPAAFGPSAGVEKAAETPGGKLPVLSVVRPVKPPVAFVVTLRPTLVPAIIVTGFGSTLRLTSRVGRTMNVPGEVAVPPLVMT